MSASPGGRRGGFARALFLPSCLAVLVLAALSVPLPLLLEQPGTPVSLGDVVTVDAADVGELDGDYLLTAVNLRPGTVAGLVRAAVDPDALVVRQSLVIPPGEDEKAYFDRQRAVFRASADVAAAVGLAAAGFDVDPTAVTGSGVIVNRVLPGAPADGVLQPGDLIVAVDGATVRVADDLRALIADGDAARDLRFVRDDAEQQASIVPGEIPTADGAIRGIGVEIQTADPRIDLPVPVAVDSGRIGGPSAGLMLALTVYDKADGLDLAAGRTIAGTGTLSPEGVVGPIGGIEQKVISAQRIDADVFVSPAEQVEAARAAVRPGSDLRIIGAATFDQAVAALRGETAGRSVLA
jgi:PDZ domain-containing protein